MYTTFITRTSIAESASAEKFVREISTQLNMEIILQCKWRKINMYCKRYL